LISFLSSHDFVSILFSKIFHTIVAQDRQYYTRSGSTDFSGDVFGQATPEILLHFTLDWIVIGHIVP
jgi:hypothetical protein